MDGRVYVKLITIPIGVVFESVNASSIKYTLRLRHEVGTDNSWETRRRGTTIQLPGSRVSPKYVVCVAL